MRFSIAFVIPMVCGNQSYAPYPFVCTGLLRDHGLTSMLLQSGLDKELAASVLRRAQWLNEHYVCCSYRSDRDLLGINMLDARRFRASA